MEALIKVFKGLGPTKTATLALVVAVVLGFFGYLMSQGSQVPMGLLFSNLDPTDGASIVDKLKNTGTPYEIKDNGTQIYVPAADIAELRMQLAQDGLPNGGSVGYEIFDKSDMLGTSSVMLDINQMRALEGELSRSVRTVQGIASARVHLVMPKRELFSKEKSDSAASVIVKMKGVARLSPNQIQAIQYLVSSAVPNLTTDHISIIDDKGTLLARGTEALGGAADSLATSQEFKNDYEEKVSRQVELLLEKTLGLDKVRAEVAVDMDFDRITTQSVDYNPDGQVAKSTSSSSEGMAEQENAASDAISIQNALPDAGANAGGVNQSKNNATRSEENTSFEISSTKRTVIREAGIVTRLSVAVLVDGTYEAVEGGKPTYKARTEEELNQLTDLVKTAVGFKEDRGDIVKVINLKFSNPPEVNIPEPSMVQKVLSEINIRRTVELLIIGTFGLILLFGWLKPVAQRIIQSIPKITKNGVEYRTEDGTFVQAGAGSAAGGTAQVQGTGGGPQQGSGAQANNNLTSQGVATMNAGGGAPGPAGAKQRAGGKTLELPQAIESMIDIENFEGRVKDSSIKKMSEVIERHPEEAVTIIRNWMYS